MLIFILCALDECLGCKLMKLITAIMRLFMLFKWLENSLKDCLQLCLSQARNKPGNKHHQVNSWEGHSLG